MSARPTTVTAARWYDRVLELENKYAALEADRDRLREEKQAAERDRDQLWNRLGDAQVEISNLRAALNERSEGERPPPDFWRGVPCGHPPDPVAWRSPEGLFVCHCGNSLDPTLDLSPVLFVREAPGPVVSCGKCGCHVACEQRRGGRMRQLEALARIALDGRCPMPTCGRGCYDIRCPHSHYHAVGGRNPVEEAWCGMHPRADFKFLPQNADETVCAPAGRRP